jgi:hypothetical protein
MALAKFIDIAFECKMSSNQMDAVKALLCIERNTVIDGKTLKLFLPDFPQSFREWIRINNPEAVFFSGLPQKIIDNSEYRDFI